MTTVQQLAGELYRAFEHKTRDNGDEFYSLKEGSPEWMTDAIQAAHDGANMLPDDWRYACIRDAASAIEDADDVADAADEFADSVDVRNSALLAWASSNLNRMSYCDDAMDEFGKPDSLAQLLQLGQMTERREVFDQLANFLASIADDDNEDEDDSED